jgi:hypothetical protein
MIKLRENEKIYLTVRPHWFVLLIELLPLKLFFIGLIVGLILALIFIPFWLEQLIDFMPSLASINISFFLIFAVSIILLILWSAIFIIITDYYLDCWIITNQRTIHTELKGLFNRTVSVIQHEQIQDISVDIHGVFPVMFNYGDVHMQTAGKFREFVFKKIANPYQAKSIIFKAQKELKEKQLERFISNKQN